MIDQPTRYAAWKAPADDGRMLIWPTASMLLEQTRQNMRRLSSTDGVRLQGVPLAQLRSQARQWLGHDDRRPMIVTGHQCELYHPGVWAKNILISALAAKLGGMAWHVVVDTDAPKHLHLRWPGGSRAITDDGNMATAAWSGLLLAPSARHVAHTAAEFARAAASWNFRPAIDPFFMSLNGFAGKPSGLVDAVAGSLHSLESGLGLGHRFTIASALWISDPFLVMLQHILGRCGEFADHYNRALREYRVGHGLRNNVRPMPDLRQEALGCEAPFWLDSPGQGTRVRPFLRRRGQGWVLTAAGGEFYFHPGGDGWDDARRLANWLRGCGLRLSPRALTLTMFLRLALADQFVHGIGGGRYDQVTDRVIETFLGMEAPKFAVTTATLYFPAAVGKRPVNLYPLFQEGRRIRHGLLSGSKREVVSRIAALPRKSPQRLELFLEMHRQLAGESNVPAVGQWEERLRQAERQQEAQHQFFDRELFFGIQSAQRLKDLIAQYDLAFRGL